MPFLIALAVGFIGTFVANGIGAYAMLPFTDFPVANQPLEPMPRTVIIAAQSGGGNNMDLSDQFFSMLPHEGGHALMDVFHTDNADLNYTSSIMYDFENSVDAPDVDKRKRVYDNPVMVTMWMAQVGAAAATSQAISMTDRLRTRSAPCLEAW